MPEMVPADDLPVAAEPVGGRSALERILFGPLPAALIIIEALAVETRRGVNQIAAAGCTTACHGVPTRLSFLKGATVVLAVVAFVMVWRYWRQHLGPRRPAGTVALAALMFFTIAAAIAPWWGLATPISLLALLIAIVAYQAAAGESDELSFPGVLRLRGVRVAVVVIVIYALFLLVIPQSSPQAIDAMLAWASHPTYVFIGVASAVLLALVVHDSALLLVHPAERAEPVVAEGRSRSAISERAALLVAGIAGVILLAVLAFYSYVAVYGVVFAAVLVALLAMTHRLPSGTLEKDAFDERLRRQVAAWLRLIAEIPLVLFGAAVTLALVEAVLGGDAGGSAWLILALVLVVGGLALLERGERDDPYDAEKPAPVFDRPALLQTQWWASIFATVAAADRYPEGTHRVGIAGVALVAAVGLLALHLWKRQHWPESAQRTRSWLILRYLGIVPLIALPVGELAGRPGAGLLVSVVVIAAAFGSRLVGRTPREAWQALLAAARGRGLGLPIARGAGIALLLGALLDVERTSSIVGTIAAVNIAAAAAIATLHSLIARFDGWSFPERRFTKRAHIANHGVPILLFLTAWVVAVFLFQPPASHRMQVMAAFGTPPLAIDATMNAFLERPNGAAAGSGPRPIFLIASDGGGARASYWTALLLDCAVAARVPHKAQTGTPCASGRDASVKAQIARASRIFAVSGVSGGGVGSGPVRRRARRGRRSRPPQGLGRGRRRVRHVARAHDVGRDPRLRRRPARNPRAGRALPARRERSPRRRQPRVQARGGAHARSWQCPRGLGRWRRRPGAAPGGVAALCHADEEQSPAGLHRQCDARRRGRPCGRESPRARAPSDQQRGRPHELRHDALRAGVHAPAGRPGTRSRRCAR